MSEATRKIRAGVIVGRKLGDLVWFSEGLLVNGEW